MRLRELVRLSSKAGSRGAAENAEKAGSLPGGGRVTAVRDSRTSGTVIPLPPFPCPSLASCGYGRHAEPRFALPPLTFLSARRLSRRSTKAFWPKKTQKGEKTSWLCGEKFAGDPWAAKRRRRRKNQGPACLRLLRIFAAIVLGASLIS